MQVGRAFARLNSATQPKKIHQDKHSWPTRFVGRCTSSGVECWVDFKEIGQTEVHKYCLASGDWYTGDNALMSKYDENTLQHGVYVDLPPGEFQLSIMCGMLFGEGGTSEIVQELTAQRRVEDRFLLQRKLQWGSDSMLLHVMNEEMSAAEELEARSQSGRYGPISKFIVLTCCIVCYCGTAALI